MLVNCSSVLRTVKECLRTASRRLRLLQDEPVDVGVPGCLVTHHTHTFLAPLKKIIIRGLDSFACNICAIPLLRKILCRCASWSFGTKVSLQGHAYKLLTRPQAIDKALLEDVSLMHRRWIIPPQKPSQQDEVTRGVRRPSIILVGARKGRLNCFMKLHARMRSTRIRFSRF